VELASLPVQLALLSLVSNAVKYADLDKPESIVELSASWADDATRTGGCRIHVEDNGIGIPVEARGRIRGSAVGWGSDSLLRVIHCNITAAS